MAINGEKSKEFEYRYMSNMVLQAEPESGRERGGPTGEADSLRGTELHPMGDKVTHEKPPGFDEKKEKAKKRKAIEQEKQIKLKKKRGNKLDLAQEHRSVLTEASHINSERYRPLTSETQAAYGQLLSFVEGKLGEVNQEQLCDAAEEVLAILKSDDPNTKFNQCKELLESLTEDEYNNLMKLSRAITDFHLEDEMELDDPDAEERNGNAEDDSVAVRIEEESEESEVDEIGDDDDSSDSSSDSESSDKENNMNDKDAGIIENKNKIGSTELDKDVLKASEIDAFWIQREIDKYVKDAEKSHQLSQEILNCLNENDERSPLETKLVKLLGVDKFQLIRLLLNNKNKILYITLLKQAQNDEDKKLIIERMENDINGDGPAILEELNQTTKADSWEKENAKNLERITKIEAKKLIKYNNNNNNDNASSNNINNIKTVFTGVVDSSIILKPQSSVNLDDLTFSQGSHLRTNRKFILPKDVYRESKKGYEEIHVPILKPPDRQPNERTVLISQLPEWSRVPFKGMKELNRIQSKLCDFALTQPDNMLLCAPTGAGKTNVAVLTILHEIGLHRREDGSIDRDKFKIVYIAPMKALVQEVVVNFSERFKDYGIVVKELSGDATLTKQQISETQIIVTTPEKWDIITRKNGERTYTQLVRLVIIDEIHLLHDERGPVLECIVARTLRQIEYTQELVRLVGLSATLPNYEDVATFLRVDPSKGLFYFDNSYRPVSLAQQYIGITETKTTKRLPLMNRITYEKCLEEAGKHQVLVFVHTRKETGKTARAIRDLALENDTITRFIKEGTATKEILLSESEKSVQNSELKDLLPYGFGIHHAGLSREDRSLVEALFANKHIQVLVCTMTLAWGVNLPAHTVIIKGTQMYSPAKSSWVEISPLDVMQMMGRAGRPQFDSQGEGIIITSHNELDFYLTLNNQQLPIESQFISKLPDNLNAEIIMGSVQNMNDAVNWLGYTYLYVRMIRNPTLYGINPEMLQNDKYLRQRRVDMIHAAATSLAKSGLIHYDPRNGSFLPTPLGRVAAHYYIIHQSMNTYNEYLKPELSDIDLFRLFSLSHEFRDIIIRLQERLEVEKLLQKVPIPVKGSAEDPHAKVNVLLQAYISRLTLKGFEINSDLCYVQQSAGRILRAIFEIALYRGWSSLAIKTLTLCKMVDRRQWLSQSPLRQFSGLKLEIIKRLEKKDLEWDKYFDLQPHDLGELVKNNKVGRDLYTLIHKFPRLTIEANFQPITRSTLAIECIIKSDFEYDTKIHGVSENFHLIVEDVDGEKILYHEYFSIKQKYANDEQIMNFTVTLIDPLPPQYFIRIVSDKWLHSETVLPVSFRHLVLPEKYPPHTELLDMRPFKIDIFGNNKIEEIYKSRSIEVLNQIQTQVFSSLYEEDNSTLICCPAGSGKTLCAEIAILRLFRNKISGVKIEGEINKCVYISPLQCLIDNLYPIWNYTFNDSLGINIVKLTGDSIVDRKLVKDGEIVMATPEQFDMISRKWKQKSSPLQQVNLFIIDDLHTIGGNKGATYEMIISRMRYMATQLSKQIRIIGLSVSLANGKTLGSWLGCKVSTIFNFHPNVKPIPLEIYLQGFDINYFGARMLAMAKPAYNGIVAVSDKESVLVYVPSRKQCQLTAIDMITYASANDKPFRFLKTSEEEITKLTENIKDPALKETLLHGVGFYHEGMTEYEKRIVKDLYKNEKIQIIVTTNSCCYSLDLYSRTVVIMDTMSYDGNEHRYIDYPISDILQMIGRSSRQNKKDIKSNCILLCHSSKRDYYKKFLYEPLPIESHLDHFLHDHLNAEIVTKTIQSMESAIDFMTYTFYYRRLSQNPNYYNMETFTNEHISQHLSDLIENTINDLVETKCVELSEENELSALNLGLISAYYSINYLTIGMFASSLNEKVKIRGLINILSAANEYSEIIVRHHEAVAVERMANHLPYRIENEEKPNRKVNVLLQSHIKRLPLPPDMKSDLKDILQNSTRFIQALVDVITSNGWLKPALSCMDLSQMLTQGMCDNDNILLQIPHFNAEIVERCKSKGVENVSDILELDDDVRNELLQLNDDQLQDVALFCNNYPDITVSYKIEEEIESGSTMSIDVLLKREIDEEEMNDPKIGIVICPRFMNSKIENWWVLIGDPETNTLYSIKRTPLKIENEIKLEFNSPEESGNYKYKLYLVSDSYFGCDQEFDIEFTVK